MTEQPNPALRFVEVLQTLAEGRFDLPDWIAWWEEHKGDVEAAMLPGWTLRLKPGSDPLRTLLHSQAGACYILDALKISYTKSDRYDREWKDGFARFCAEQKEKGKERAKEYEPGIKAISTHFPKFARFLKKRATDIETMEPPATAIELADLERSLGVALPEIHKQFLLCTRSLRIGGLDLSVIHADIVSSPKDLTLPTEGMLAIADYFLEADGDQVLFAPDSLGESDPPVFYYAHAGLPPAVRQMSPHFSTWIESLPKSPMFG
ncbi:hypothetical protein AYO40_05275 [Planctomycetaceae bacterium SCGC AG-212-D15]|nr:hypothetical protein AYO40_05275 [Planctomycetaceae bacterium SCGC AG-212-D15]